MRQTGHNRWGILIQAACLITLLWGQLGSAWAQDRMGGMNGPPPTVPYLSADGTFALKHPKNWQPQENPGRKGQVRFLIMGAPDAWLEVQRMSVIDGARPKQMVLRAREDRLKKLPHFEETIIRELRVNEAPGASILGSYWYQGNAQFPRTVEEVFVIAGNEAYAFHFECFAPMAPMLAPELNMLYLSLVAHPATSPAPAEGSSGGDSSGWDNLPF